jgi:hypothetical protein
VLHFLYVNVYQDFLYASSTLQYYFSNVSFLFLFYISLKVLLIYCSKSFIDFLANNYIYVPVALIYVRRLVDASLEFSIKLT